MSSPGAIPHVRAGDQFLDPGHANSRISSFGFAAIEFPSHSLRFCALPGRFSPHRLGRFDGPLGTSVKDPLRSDVARCAVNYRFRTGFFASRTKHEYGQSLRATRETIRTGREKHLPLFGQYEPRTNGETQQYQASDLVATINPTNQHPSPILCCPTSPQCT